MDLARDRPRFNGIGYGRPTGTDVRTGDRLEVPA